LIIKNMDIPNKSTISLNTIGTFCDWGMVYALSAAVFFLPVSIALLNTFAVLAIFFYLLKKITRIVIDWPLKTTNLNFNGKIRFIWESLGAPVNVLNRPLLFLVFAMFLSVVFSQYPALSLKAFVGKFLKCVFLYFSFIEVFTDEKRIWMFLKFFMAGAFLTALSGVIQHFFGWEFFRKHLLTGNRVNSFFYTANGFGAYLLPVIGLVIHFLYTAIVRNKSWVSGVVLAFFLVLLLTCLCWTYSRSSWIGFLAILFAMVLLDWRKLLIVGALLLVFIFIFLPSLNNVRHMHLINDSGRVCKLQNEDYNHGVNCIQYFTFVIEQGGGDGRVNFWKKAVSIIRLSPVCGTGLNTYSRIIKRDPNRDTWWYAHNCYLQLTAETGLIGLTCFLWMLFVLLRHGFNCCKQIKDLWPLTILQGTLAGLFGFLVQSCFDNTFYTVQLGMLMWFFFGLMMAVTRLKPVLHKETALG